MKKLFYAAGLCIALSFGCSDSPDVSVLFAGPQPEDAGELEEFPAGIRGEYGAAGDSIMLTVAKQGIFRKIMYRSVSHVNELDSTDELIGDTVVRDRTSGISFPVTRSGDSLKLEMPVIDTLFLIDDKHVLRKFRSALFLNIQHEQGWRTERLEKKRNQLIWSRVNVNEAEKLKELSANYTDSIPFQFELSAVQFRKYLRGNAFQNADTFLVKSRRSGL